MAYYAVVIDDPDLAHKREQQRHHRKYAVKRQRGELHDHLDDTCPLCQHCGHVLEGHLDDGSCLDCDCTTPVAAPNCRNCGDPAFAESCRAAGHCEHCGVRHGVAPDAVLKANGYRLVKLDGPPRAGQIWDAATERFIDGA